MALNAPPLEPGSGTFGGRTAARQRAAAAATSHGSTRSYAVGFLLSAILTVIPFAMVMVPGLSHGEILAGVLASAVVQVGVHIIYFLHLNLASDDARWNAFTFAFTGLITAILISGSVWVMFHLTTNMEHHMTDAEAVIPR